jgi:hypothetical protein
VLALLLAIAFVASGFGTDVALAPTTGTARPIPRPAGLDNVGMVRMLFSDPPVALDEISAIYGPICALGAGPVRVVA